ncbi:hypothetical protein GCM10011247_07340 [Pseudomonas plecoglossicida]|nr:hypothetical protein GCM10011247_07340 [Pseudomonas plecoglossicida]
MRPATGAVVHQLWPVGIGVVRVADTPAIAGRILLDHVSPLVQAPVLSATLVDDLAYLQCLLALLEGIPWQVRVTQT